MSLINIFWFRRDLRLHDNTGLYHALQSEHPVLPVFIFDTDILNGLENQDDARVTFIHQRLKELNAELKKYGSSLLVKHGNPLECWQQILDEYALHTLYFNHDYEPYAGERDLKVSELLQSKYVEVCHFKDHVIFEKDEILKDNAKPYTVFTPYKNRWLKELDPSIHLASYQTEKHFKNLYQHDIEMPALKDLGFIKNDIEFPKPDYLDIIENYHQTRNIPSLRGTSHIGLHLRFGTLSVRNIVKDALNSAEKTWLVELIWREFYAMILWHFPHTINSSFKTEYDKIQWRNNEDEFRAWCEGKTGYPLVDAGMRELNATGFMHNRVRMVTASFLTKHLLIDWRWGEAYFAQKLLDYDMASNVGGWQWAAGCGNDAAPYFRIFNPELQAKRFDPQLKYIRKWIPEFDDPFKYPRPIVEHKFARERVLNTYKNALSN
ncbi:MAG TPA: deoxyribodipyrimidine photo-lyase [Sphingobacteriaceae bacterium]|nr:deoxyribodipyrimidine photo-lyase [Sphingobacteriaceae bacterium]